MAITYTWSINQIQCLPTHDGETDVVMNVTWACRGKDENGLGSSRGGVSDIPYVKSENFTQFNDLTEDVVLGWVKPLLDTDRITQMETEIKGDIDWQIAQESANTPKTPPLPWPMKQPGI